MENASKIESLLLVGALAGGAYLVYKALAAVGSGAKAAAGAVAAGFTATGNAVGSGLYSLFGPSDAQALGSMTYLTVNFPDGSTHAVGNQQINSDGSFLWNGYPPGSSSTLALQLVKDSSGAWYATAPAGTTLAAAALAAQSYNLSPGGSPVVPTPAPATGDVSNQGWTLSSLWDGL